MGTIIIPRRGVYNSDTARTVVENGIPDTEKYNVNAKNYTSRTKKTIIIMIIHLQKQRQ